MPEAIHADMEEARAGLYEFFSWALMREPTEAFLQGIGSDQLAGPLQEIFAHPRYRQELEQVRLDLPEGNLSEELARLDFEALLRVPGADYLTPYESVYRARLGDGGRGHLCGAAALEVEKLYLQEGLEPGPEFSELPDHAGVELEFMARLCRKTAAAQKDNCPHLAAEYRWKQRLFLINHLTPWVPLLAHGLRAQARTSFYRFLGVFLQLFLKLENDLYGQGEVEVATGKPAPEHQDQEMRP
jgi:TorA maturation chaperone TorD